MTLTVIESESPTVVPSGPMYSSLIFVVPVFSGL